MRLFVGCLCLALILPTALMLSSAMPAESQQFGLEWDGSGSARRMLYWNSPPPIYGPNGQGMTYVFRVFPRKKIVPQNSPTGYYTTFFWGNNGPFDWQPGFGNNTYYGMHPYPGLGAGAPNGAGSWEISVYGVDPTTGVEVVWDRWYQQAIRVRRLSAAVTEHEFYYDWPDQTKLLTYTVDDTAWAAVNPPNPAIVVGQAPDLCGPPPCSSGQSWGGYPGWEEFNGIIRGMQFYTTYLSLADIAAEVNQPKSSAAGLANIWYLNLDPRPTDVADKKNVGTPHTPSWAGTTALEWSGSGSTTPPSSSPPPPPPPSGVDFTIQGISEGQTVAGSITVRAVPSGAIATGIEFSLINGAGATEYFNAEGVTPYCLNGDDGQTCWPFSTTAVPNGIYTLRVVMNYSGGQLIKLVHLTIANGGSSPPPPPPPPSGFDFTITGVSEGQAVTGSITVRATPSGTTPTSISFTLINAAGVTRYTNTERVVPYCLNGDNGTTCFSWSSLTVPNGTYTLRVVMAYSGGSITKDVHFTIEH